MLERYATEALPPALRLRLWTQQAMQVVSLRTVRPYDADRFRARQQRNVVHEAGFVRIDTTPAVATGPGSSTGGWAVRGRAAVVLTLLKHGTACVTQGGRRLQLNAGDVFLRDDGRSWELDAAQPSTLLQVKLAADLFRERIGDPAEFVCEPLRATESRTAVLATLIEESARLALDPRIECAGGDLGAVVLGAAQAAWGVKLAAGGAAANADRLLAAAIRCIETRFADPAFTVESLASDLGLSLRSLQRLFERQSFTPKRCLTERRLDHAARALRESRGRNTVHITGIALASGFNDPAYFSRAFRQRFGVTPSGYRRRGG